MAKPTWAMTPQPKPTREKSVKAKQARGRAVKPRSDRRRDDEKQYAEQRRFFLELRHYECELRFPDICTGLASEVQHLRGRTASDYLDMSTWAASCHQCHDHATNNPTAAFEAGAALRRNTTRSEP